MTIKETAGKVLLYFYQLQRTAPSSLRRRQLGFIDKEDGGVSVISDKKWLVKDLLDINRESSDIFNAFVFLREKGLIDAEERATASTRIYIGLRIAGKGIDLIEGIERGTGGKEVFTVMFNINVDSSADVEALIKTNLNMLFAEG
ncbi:MAG: hypothetical protein ACSLEY_00340 [Candidatus Saccharimonadales bacterium]